MRMKLHTISALFSTAAVLALTLPSQAVTVDDLKSAGFVRGATANEVPYGYMDESGAARASALMSRLQSSRNSASRKSTGQLLRSARSFPA